MLSRSLRARAETRAGLRQPRFFLRLLRPQHRELVALGGQGRAGLVERGLRLAGIRIGALEALPAGEVARGESGVSALVEAGPFEIDIGAGHARLGLADYRLLEIETVRIGRDGRFGSRDHSLGLCRLCREIAILDDEHDIAGGDRLVVADADLPDVAVDLWADNAGIGLNVGIVGQLDKAPLGPPVPAGRAGERREDHDHEKECGVSHQTGDEHDWTEPFSSV